MNTPILKSSTDLPNASKRLVTVIDDDKDICELYCLVLHRAGYLCKSFTNGQSFLTHLHDSTDTPDLIICDLTMPDIDGNELVAKIRGIGRFAKAKVILSSGAGDLQKTAKQLGINGVLVKPVSTKTLLATVQQQLGKQ